MNSDSIHMTIMRPSTPNPSFLVTGKTDRAIRPCTVLDEDYIKLKDDDIAKGMAMIHASDLLASRGEVDQAVASLKRSIEFFRSWPTKMGDVYLALGHLYMTQSSYDESDTNFKIAKEQFTKVFEDKKWLEKEVFPKEKMHYYLQNRLCCVFSHLGSIAFSRHDFKSAEDYFHQALDEAKKSAIAGLYIDRNFPLKDWSVVKEARLNVAECFSNLACLCAEQSNRHAAIKHYNDALALQIQELGEDNDTVAKTLYNIGTLHYRSQEYNLALKSYKQVLKMRKMLFGPRHISNAEILIEIATAHEKNEEIDMALSALKAADTIISLHYGHKQIGRGLIAFRVGAMYTRRGDAELALTSLNRAFAIYKDNGLEDSHALMKTVQEVIRYIKGEDKTPFISAQEYISTLLDDKLNLPWTPVKADSLGSSVFFDNRDDNDDVIDRTDQKLDFVSL